MATVAREDKVECFDKLELLKRKIINDSFLAKSWLEKLIISLSFLFADEDRRVNASCNATTSYSAHVLLKLKALSDFSLPLDSPHFFPLATVFLFQSASAVKTGKGDTMLPRNKGLPRTFCLC